MLVIQAGRQKELDIDFEFVLVAPSSFVSAVIVQMVVK